MQYYFRGMISAHEYENATSPVFSYYTLHVDELNKLHATKKAVGNNLNGIDSTGINL